MVVLRGGAVSYERGTTVQGEGFVCEIPVDRAERFLGANCLGKELSIRSFRSCRFFELQHRRTPGIVLHKDHASIEWVAAEVL